MKKGSLNGSTITFPKNFQHNYTWKVKEWNYPCSSLSGDSIWSDGKNIYYTHFLHGSYVLNGDTWEEHSIVHIGDDPITGIGGQYIWTDGNGIYYTYDDCHYSLIDGVWKEVFWVNSRPGCYVWSDGKTIYASRNNGHYQQLNGNLNSLSTWDRKTWNITENKGFWDGKNVWTDGENVYLSHYYLDDNDDSHYMHYVLIDGLWQPKTWNVIDITGDSIWTDGTYIYAGGSYVLKDGIWEPVEWNSPDGFYGGRGTVWSDGTNIYYSSRNKHYVLERTDIDPVPQLNPAALMQGYMVARMNRK